MHSRHRFVSQARLHATLQALSAVHYSPLCEYEGDDRTGTYVYHNGCGDHFAMAWSLEGFVALVFDHDMNDEANAPEEQWDPERFFRKVPAALAPLVSRVITLGHRAATGSLWITEEPDARWDATGQGLDMLGGFALSAEAALFGAGLLQSWRELSSVSEEQARLAMRLAEASSRGPIVLRPEDEATMLAKPPEGLGDPPPENAPGAALLFTRLGITWNDPERAVTLANEARKRADREALGALQVDLLEASMKGDVEGVRAALGRGARVDCVAYDGLFDDTAARLSGRDLTPLDLAAGHGHLEVVDVLLSAGAVVSARARATLPSPLYLALRHGDVAVIRRVIAAGPPFDATTALEVHCVWHAGERRAKVEVIRLLLSMGAVLDRRAREDVLFAALAAGDDELAALSR
jgi:hypothetical protein